MVEEGQANRLEQIRSEMEREDQVIVSARARYERLEAELRVEKGRMAAADREKRVVTNVAAVVAETRDLREKLRGTDSAILEAFGGVLDVMAELPEDTWRWVGGDIDSSKTKGWHGLGIVRVGGGESVIIAIKPGVGIYLVYSAGSNADPRVVEMVRAVYGEDTTRDRNRDSINFRVTKNGLVPVVMGSNGVETIRYRQTEAQPVVDRLTQILTQGQIEVGGRTIDRDTKTSGVPLRHG